MDANNYEEIKSCSRHENYIKSCYECNKIVKLNWYHAHKFDTLYCEICKKSVEKYRYNRHLLSKKHQNLCS